MIKSLIKFIFCLIPIALISAPSYAQEDLDSLFDEQSNSVDEGSANESYGQRPELITEKIFKISHSKRILILTNNENGMNKGDFITFIHQNKRVARALVAKTEGSKAGVKFVKVLDKKELEKFRNAQRVSYIRGDDSFYRPKKKEDELNTPKLLDNDDLYDKDIVIDDDLELEENNKRVIKTDNLVSLVYGRISALNASGGSESYGQPNGHWAYQARDNFWLEFGYGQNLIEGFPDSSIDTKLQNFTLRVKYAISAPLFFTVMPYVGLQLVKADSPGAGNTDGTQLTEAQKNRELNLVKDLEKKGLSFGITALRRLVPGWFLRFDLGSDLMSLGLTLEF